MQTSQEIAVIIPCYRCLERIEDVIARIGPEVAQIVIVDDACTQNTGKHVEAQVTDSRVTVLYQEENTGVGGATLRGMSHARKAGADILVKIDGDGQMAPELVKLFAAPIAAGQADYAKGNRFHTYHLVRDMPYIRFLGNGLLSFLTKLSSGYWNVFDPANGYVAISGAVFDELSLEKISHRYFFETDMLCQLGLLRAVVVDVPIQAIYDGEPSGLSPLRELVPFLFGNLKRFFHRVAYTYFLRDFSLGSLYLLAGVPLLFFGMVYGIRQWMTGVDFGMSAGAVMLAALPVMLGFFLILNFFAFDVAMTPQAPLHPGLKKFADLPTSEDPPFDGRNDES